ncbi:MAG: hypothetical protein OXH22_07365 [Chloroflexi bacterium]|nr:hypothetical protein [Chloroflexota bacterium]
MADNGENARLQRAFDRLPKSGSHGSTVTSRHPDVRQEWIISIIEEPYDEWIETHERSGQRKTIVVGRVPEFEQWVKVVFIGVGDNRELLTAYPDRRLSKRYVVRPWQSL